MLGVHSLAPVKLYGGTTTTTKTKPTIRRVVSTDDDEPPPQPPSRQEPDAADFPDEPVAMAEQAQDASARGMPTSDEAAESIQPEPPVAQEQHPEPQTAQRLPSDLSAGTDMTDSSSATAGPASNEPPPVDPAPSNPDVSARLDPEEVHVPTPATTRPDETHANAITYRRDPETVISYLVPLPQPMVQGRALEAPAKYFLYAPPPPHLVKPAHGGEGYAVWLTRHWQKSVRRAKMNAHNGKKVSWRGVRSKGVRAVMWGLNKLKYDDVAFLARVHPKTVTHLILIHPSDLSGRQTPEEILSTFRAQIFESKKRAKRNSIISATLFAPALLIDTAALFFGGLAEIDGIWMLVSITAYRTARLITQKMGPDPKTLEISRDKLIEDARRDKTPPEKEESDDESETGAIRRSVDALRRGVGNVTQRMSLQIPRRKGRKSESGVDRASNDEDAGREPAQTTHAEEAGDPSSVAPSQLSPTTRHSTDMARATREAEGQQELSGVLEHGVEEEEEPQGEVHAADPSSSRRSAGGIFQVQDGSAGEGISATSGEDAAIVKNKGQNFQLTFYPSPAMEVLDQYVQHSCHLRNVRAFNETTTPAPSEGDVLAAMGWKPERRRHQNREQQQQDEEWQAREAEEDLRLFAAKAAKSWDKACRKEAKRVGRSTRGVKFLPRVFPHARGASKEKATQQPPASTGQERQVDAQEKQVKKPSLKKRFLISGMKTRLDEKKQDENTPKKQRANGGKKAAKASGAAAAAAALLCIPCVAVSQRVRNKSKNGQSDEEEVRDEKKRPSLKDRLAARKTASKAKRDEAPGVEGNKSGGLAAAILNLKIVSMAPKREGTSEKARRRKNKFSALKKRVKALRKKIVKRVRSLRPRRKSNSEQVNTLGTFDRPENVKSAKTQGAMAGLVAGCLALPAGLHNKAKQLQGKNKQKKRDENKRKLDAMMGQPDPVPAAPGPPALDVPLTPQPPMPIPEPEEPHQALVTQYLPGHGQSEIPVSAELSAVSGPGNREIQDDEQARGLQNPDQISPETTPAPASSAAAAKFKSFRDGMNSFTTRASRRGTGNNTSTAEETTAAGTEGLVPALAPAARGPSSLLAPLGGSLPGLKAFRAKRGGDDGTTSTGQQAGAAVAAQESLAPHHDEEAHHADLDAGIEPATKKTPGNKSGGNLGTFMRRNNGEKPVVVKDKVYKDGSGFMERMRTIWYL